MKQLRGYAMVASGAFLWGCAATAAKLLLTREVNTILLVQTRVTFSVVLMPCDLALFRRDLFTVRVKDLWRMALPGVERFSILQGAGAAPLLCAIVMLQVRREKGGEEIEEESHVSR